MNRRLVRNDLRALGSHWALGWTVLLAAGAIAASLSTEAGAEALFEQVDAKMGRVTAMGLGCAAGACAASGAAAS